MNLEEWNLRMRAQKEQERKKKTESAEMLRGYRGGVLKEEDTRLAELRREDRRKHTETAEMLRGYRGDGGATAEEDRKLALLKQEDRRKHRETEEMLHNYRAEKVDGEGRERRHARRAADGSHPPVSPNRGNDNLLSTISPGSVSAMAGKFSNLSPTKNYYGGGKLSAAPDGLPPPPVAVKSTESEATTEPLGTTGSEDENGTEFHQLPSLDEECPEAWKKLNAAAADRAKSHPSASLPSLDHLTMKDCEYVYEPAEDTYLLLDAIQYEFEHGELARLKDRPQHAIAVEIGCGSGVPSVFLRMQWSEANEQHQQQQLSSFATDINPEALRVTRETAIASGVWNDESFKLVQCDLASKLLPGLAGKVDVLLFNPPYVPTQDEEVGGTGIEASWAGGVDGRRVVDRAVPQIGQLLKHRGSAPTRGGSGGVAYLITVDDNRPHELAERFRKEEGLEMKPLFRRRARNEYLTVQKITRIQPDGPSSSTEEKKVETADAINTGTGTAASCKEDEPLHDHPTVVRLDVNFTFGVVVSGKDVGSDDRPVLDGYMMAVEEVVQQAISDDSFLAEHASYNPTFGPFVQECQWDGEFSLRLLTDSQCQVLFFVPFSLLLGFVPMFSSSLSNLSRSDGPSQRETRFGNCGGSCFLAERYLRPNRSPIYHFRPSGFDPIGNVPRVVARNLTKYRTGSVAKVKEEGDRSTPRCSWRRYQIINSSCYYDIEETILKVIQSKLRRSPSYSRSHDCLERTKLRVPYSHPYVWFGSIIIIELTVFFL